ncbi:MAG: FG-GAP-like repeat-containing protein [Planctomycetota bacterium]|nr:FG-GAP-like repeat-containing protein [Planctomycetota bacterium]
MLSGRIYLFRGFFMAILVFTTIHCAEVSAQQFLESSTGRLPVFNEYSSQVAIADVDGDGDLDLCFANGRGFFSATLQERVRLLINDGNATFTDESVARLGDLIGYGRDVEFGDVDGDGDLDLAVANDFLTPQNLLINDGTGFFTDESATRIPQFAMSSSHCAFGDIDDDGDLDLWYTRGGTSRFGSGQAQLWINDGLGFYINGTAQLLPQQLVSEPMDCIFGDLDGDLDLDMIEGHRAGNSKLYINNGGFFVDATAGNFPADSNTYSYDLGDLDADGDLDVFGANSGVGSREAVFHNDGNASFTDVTTTVLPNNSNPNIDDNDSKFLDYDNDGDLDVTVCAIGGPERMLRNNGSGFLTLVAGVISSISDSSLDVELGDLDGDGDLDMVTAQGESGAFRNRLYLNQGLPDSRAPNIAQWEELDDVDVGAGPRRVRAVVRDSMSSDHGAFYQAINLEWSDGGPFQEVPMAWSGHQLYRGLIPDPGTSAIISYRVRATDWAGNTVVTNDRSYFVGTPPALFQRGDINDDGGLNIADAVAGLVYLFGGGAVPGCLDTLDCNDDGANDISDVVFLLDYLFQSGNQLPAPNTCGFDPTDDPVSCDTTQDNCL